MEEWICRTLLSAGPQPPEDLIFGSPGALMLRILNGVRAIGERASIGGNWVSQPGRVSLRNERDKSHPEQHAEKHGSPPDCELGAGP